MYLLQVMFALLRRGNLKMLSWIATPGSASVHVDLMQAQVPDATTRAKMRHSLKAAGITARGGSMVDVTFIEAPSPTKNKDHARDP